MLALAFIRDHPEQVRAGLMAKGVDAPLDEILELDQRWRAMQSELEQLNQQQNLLGPEIGRQRDPVQRQAAIQANRRVSDAIKRLEPEATAWRAHLDELLLLVPNLPHQSVPVGPDESANVLVRQWGAPRTLDFVPLHHGCQTAF